MQRQDPLGLHVYTCSQSSVQNPVRNDSHASLCTTVRRIILSAIPKVSVTVSAETKEPKYDGFFQRLPNSNYKEDVSLRGDIIIQDPANALPATIIDVTIAHPTSNISAENFETPGAASEQASRNKFSKINRIYDLSNTAKASVAIVGLDTTGAFSNSALNFCRFLTQTTPPDPEYAPKLCHLKQALSVAMMQIITEKHQEVMDKYSFMDFEQ